jgi:ligand-binding sensor domain-containing protein
MKLHILLLLSILTLFTSCNGQTQKTVDIKSEQTKKTIVGDTVSELDKTIFIVFQANNKDYWFGSDGQGVFRYDGKTILHFTTNDGLCNDRIREIKEDKSGNIFIVTLEGVSKYDGQKFFTTPVIESNEWKMEPGDLWFKAPGKNGTFRYDGTSLYHLEFPKHYLADDFYKAIPNPPYNPYEVYTIYEDSKGNLWFGTSNFGICRFDGKTLSWMYEKHLTEIEGGGQFCIRSIIEDKEGKFWFCNTSYRYNILSGSLIEDDKILINYKREKGIDNIKSPEGRDMIYFMSVVEDKKGDLWMLTYEQGVWRYDGKKLTHYSVKDGSGDLKLYSIYKDKHDELWLGTHDGGAYKFNGNQFKKLQRM